MPPARRARLSSRPCSTAAAADPRGGRGWLSARRKPSKRPRPVAAAYDDGAPLMDEILLAIFAGLAEIADLVRCAATCRRWRRLVSREAAFICRTMRRRPRRFIHSLALGFFHLKLEAVAVAGVNAASATAVAGVNAASATAVAGVNAASATAVASVNDATAVAGVNAAAVTGINDATAVVPGVNDATATAAAAAAAGSRSATLRFAPMASASRLLGLQLPSLDPLVEGLDAELFDTSRVVASRNGLIVLDLRRGKNDKALKLCVCNPMTGEVTILPTLAGKDSLGHYACAVLTADDHDHDTTDPPRSPSSYRLLLLYSRRGFTAFRSFSSSSASGIWTAEAKVTNARLGKKQMGVTRNSVVSRNGKVAYWLAKNVVFSLRLDTMEAAVASLPWSGQGRAFDMQNTLLGMSPEGRLRAVQIKSLCKKSFTISVSTCSHDASDDWFGEGRRWWATQELIKVEQPWPGTLRTVKLRWLCEKSGVVFFNARYSDRSRCTDMGFSDVYALSLGSQAVERVGSYRDGTGNAGVGDPWENLHGYEMDMVAYLTTLGERDDDDDDMEEI